MVSQTFIEELKQQKIWLIYFKSITKNGNTTKSPRSAKNTALLIYRLLEKKLDMIGEHFTTESIIETLKNMEVINIDDLCYASTYTSSRLMTALNSIYEMGLDKKYYQPKDLNSKIRSVKK